MKNIFYTGVLGLIIVLYSCKVDEHDDCGNVITLEQDVKDYMLHPVGSYWVYQDSVSSKLDTITIKSRSIGESGGEIIGGCVNTEEIIDVNKSSRESKSHKGYYNVNVLEKGSSNKQDVYVNLIGGSVYFGNIKDSSYQTSLYDIEYLGDFSSIDFDVRTYRDVKKYNLIQNNKQVVMFSGVLYIAKGIGYIRKEYNNGEVWNLIDYKVD